MDNAAKKRRERYVVSQAALKLGVNWVLPTKDREEPDFLISERDRNFGLEVTTCYIGPVGKENSKKGGAERRQRESINEKWLRGVVSDFEHCKGIKLKLSYVGKADEGGKDAILSFLKREKFEYLCEFETRIWRGNGMTVQAYRSPCSRYEFVMDQVGWVFEGGDELQAAIDKKSPLVPKYRKVCPDTRLLVVANREYNSGKLILPERFTPNLGGFHVVYFFSYPESVTVFGPLP